ncbi:chorion peroxidase-like [Littorina saxatilis]|uniref:Peroxidase n=1 Tax=Littorina saxatilis TaxID=31220 RepID=A0AAN9G3P3_9CAEN
MILLLVSVLLCCHAAVAVNGGSFMYTHPETCLPLVTGLIGDVQTVQTFRNVTTVTRGSTRRSTNSFAARTYQVRNPCDTFVNLIFRTADGSCNNRLTRGQSLQPLDRLLPAVYSDGIQAPRVYSVLGNGRPLPSPRVVSRVVHPDKIAPTDLTIFVMQWGQFMDHEMVSTPLPIEDTRGTVQCCGANAGPPTGLENSECFPILFPPGDPDFRGTCMEFVRSQPKNDSAGNMISPRENENLITSFIDASTVYGSTQERQDELRDPVKRYLLRTTRDNFPPDNGIDDCVKRDANDICFLAGDDRVNELPSLTLMHTIFVRYHNLLAKDLKHCRPDATDELIFQQARAIVGAVMQNILYAEWLPIVLGPSVRSRYGLDLNPNWRTRHIPDMDPSIFSAFSTAVFRFGHTLIPRSLPLSPTRRVLLREIFFKPFEARENLDTLAQGLVEAADSEDRTQEPDRFFVKEVTSHLFENQEGLKRGFDLLTLNMQRGRDHGIPSYNAFRQRMGLSRVASFADPALGTGGSRIAAVYDHVDDIDLFSGAMCEPAFDGGLVGETFSNMMALQFRKLKFGDRFFFNNYRRYFGFRDLQVNLLRRIRLAHILCLTTGLRSVQLNVFRVASARNPRVSCEKFKRDHPHMTNFQRYPF